MYITEREGERTLCCTHSKREVGGGGLGKEEKSIRTTHSTERQRETESAELHCWQPLVWYTIWRPIIWQRHLNKSQRRKSSAKNTNIKERESGIELRFIYLLGVRGWSGEFRAERDFPDKSDERNESAAVWNRVQNEGIGWCNTSGDFSFFLLLHDRYCSRYTQSVHTHTQTLPPEPKHDGIATTQSRSSLYLFFDCQSKD